MSPNRKRPLTQTTFDNEIIQEKRPKNDNSAIKRKAGTIVRIVLKNFMCHSHLEVNLNNNINYIIGRNGSGKSAILTALLVGLGGKASITNRGTSVKGFVKAGKSSATVEIVLNNSGSAAYRPSTYGNQIIIQRHFTASGNSSYKIKSSAGLIISKSSKELRQILTHLNIQIDNPVCVLNQDTSRNFLSTSDPKQKFILFMRATRLETLCEEYKNIANNKRETLHIYKEKEQVYNELKQLVKDLEKKIKNFSGVAELKNRLASLQGELVWAKVRDAEQEHVEKVQVVDELETKYTEYVDNSENRGQRLEEIKKRVSELQRQILELKDAAEVQNRPQLDLQNEISGLKQAYTEKRQRKQQLLKQIKDKNKNIEAITKEIENFNANLSKIEQEKLAKKKEMASLEEKITHIENMSETTQNDVFQMKSNLSRQGDRENDLQKESRQIKAQYDNLTDRINTLKSESNNKFLLYGRDMPQIINAIQKNKRKFKELPRGPLGAYINIKDKSWAVAIEGFLGAALLHTFTVDNKQDNVILMDIFNKTCTGRKPAVITGKFFNKVHDIRPNLVHADGNCVSLYDAIDVKDPVVANCLIDQRAIESILLIPSTEIAIELLSDQRRVPKNCSQGVTIKGDKYFPDPNYKMYASRYHNARFLQVDTQILIRGYEDNLAELAARLKTTQGQIDALAADKSKQKTELAELTAKLEKLRLAGTVAKRKMEELRLAEDPELTNVQSLETEMSELKETVQQLTGNCETMDDQMNHIQEHIEDAEGRLREIEEIAKGVEERIAPLEEQIMEQSKRKRELDVNSTFEKKRLEEVKNRLEIARSEALGKENEVKKLAQEASSVCEREQDLRKVVEIVNEINGLQSDIRKAASNMERPEEVKAKYDRTRNKYKQVTDVMTSLERNIKVLETAVAKRSRNCKFSENYFIGYINHNFSRVLDFRQFQGSLEVNMEEKKLDLVVIPQQGSQGHTATSNLSGGERSFSTVAFLYSLWQCMDFPFYFLDEFDVYMDKINRTKVMEILIHHSKSRPHLQYVFLTPQDVSFIKDDDVSIHKLEDPERRAVPER